MSTATAGFAGITSAQRKTLIAAAMGWALDAFDVMLYALVLAYIMRDLHMTKQTAGLLGTLTLLASGIGGVMFGFIADRIGRTKALMLSIATYSVCSFASGLATSVTMLAVFRFVLGLGMGGEWNTGATLVAETWPTHLRAKAISIVQSSWALGYAAAALVAGLLLREFNWRIVFFVGILPAFVILWIRRSVPESEMWMARQRSQVAGAPSAKFSEIFSRPFLKNTIALLALNFFGMFAWWGLFTWLPPYLSLPIEKGGLGFNLMDSTRLLLVLNLVGMFPGYASFGWVADKFGRRKSFILYTGCAAVLVPIYANARAPWAIMVLGTLVAFFGTGFFSGSGIIASEIFPTRVRARALGFTYNGARTLSSISPAIIGRVADHSGLSGAFYLCAAGFFLAAVVATQLPETLGKELD
ncbi:MAG: major facilitator superfamily transporter [Acidobacteriales bacterium]|nr:major facilitator superfamily transporter [Terriglobales bacterium]